MYKKMLFTLSLTMMFSVVWAQDEDTDEPSKRPSWSEGLPERQNTADLNAPDFKPEIDNDIEIDMSEFGIKPKADITLELPISAELPEESAEPVEEPQPVESLAVEEAEAEPVVNEPVETKPEPVEEAVVESQATGQVITEPEPEEIVTEPAIEQMAEVEEPVDSAPADTLPAEEPVEVEETLAAVEPPVMAESDPVESAQDQQQDYVWSITKQTPVQYPVKAAIDNLEGWVDVEVTINADGEVVSATPVKYSRRGRIFGKPAVQSVSEWLFEPPKNFGIETNVTRVYKIEFNL